MKRYGYLYEKIIDKENLLLAYKKAKKDKSHYREVKNIEENVTYFIDKLHEMLKKEEYKVGKYKIEIKNDKGKERHLYKLPFYPDRVIQWAILLQLEPIFMKCFTINTSASIKGRGIHHAYKLMTDYLKDVNNTTYYLKIDIKKFYDNIDKQILKKKLERKFKDQKLLKLIYLIIDSFPKDKGIPIGSYLSQFLANFYLSDLDHFIKEKLKCEYYIRYMDDIVILNNNKLTLHKILSEIFYFLNKDNLEVKNNFRVGKTDKGIDFIGYVFFSNYISLRKSTKIRMIKKFRKISNNLKLRRGFCYSDFCTINSYNGWLNWCNSYKLKVKYVDMFKHVLRFYRKRCL